MDDYNLTLFDDGKVKFHLRHGHMSSDWLVVKEVYQRDCYQFKPEYLTGGVVVDIGANIGTFCIPLPTDVTVLAFEPEPENFAMLKRNIEENKRDNIIPFNVALGEPGETRMIALQGGSHMDAPQGSVVKRISLDSVGFDQCDFLKIDCEGAEYQIFDNTSDKTLKKIKRIAAEFHPFDKAWHDETMERLDKFFELETIHGGIVLGAAR